MLITENIIGKYITLEPISISHKESLRVLTEDQSIWKYYPYNASGENFDAWFEKTSRKTNDDIEACFAVRCNHSNNIIGCTRLYDITLAYKRLAIGHTFYHQEARGTKVNTECKKLLLQTAFEKLNIERVQIMADVHNHTAVAAIKKIGATQEGVLRQYMTLENGYKRDTAVFSILKSEWPELKLKLTNKIES